MLIAADQSYRKRHLKMVKAKFIGGELDGREIDIPEIVEELEVRVDLGDLTNYLPLYHILIYKHIGDNEYKYKNSQIPSNYHEPVFEEHVER